LGYLIDAFNLSKSVDHLASKFCPQDRQKPHCALYDALASALLLQVATDKFGLSPRELLLASQSAKSKQKKDLSQKDLFDF
jgi:DNA polymerase III epsilon subunit-like protein